MYCHIILLFFFPFLKETVVNIKPRNYQLGILEDIKKVNSILYLPTGSGKTYIATMLIRDMGEPLNKYVYNYLSSI